MQRPSHAETEPDSDEEMMIEFFKISIKEGNETPAMSTQTPMLA
jgi:hypothetical protein